MRSRAAGGARDVRHLALRRSHGRFTRGPAYAVANGCGALRALQAASPVFGGRQNQPLRIAFRLRSRSAVALELRRGKRIVRRIAYKTVAAERTTRRVFAARGLARGTYSVVLRVRRPGLTFARTVKARKL
jgi:hypothetical protein